MKTRVLGFVALAAVTVMTAIALFVVPADLNQGDAQRIMYPHVASAWLAYLSFGVTALAGIGWLWKRDLRLDAVALAGAEIGVVFTAFAIWGGMMWGRPIWGVFWQWEDPRLTTTALLLALYVGYLLLRQLTDDPERRATRAAIVGIVAAIDIPIIHFSVEWWRGLHQTATIGSPDRVLESRRADAVRRHAARHARRLHARVAVPHDPPLPAGADRRGARRGTAPRPDHERANGGAGAMTDAGFVIAAYVVIIGGLAAYTLVRSGNGSERRAAATTRRDDGLGAERADAPAAPAAMGDPGPGRRGHGGRRLPRLQQRRKRAGLLPDPDRAPGSRRCGRGRDGPPRGPGRGWQRRADRRRTCASCSRTAIRRFRCTRRSPRRAPSARAREPWSRVASVADGVFEATQVIVKHDENYEAPAPGTQPSDRAFEPGDEE